jgi:chlorobactene glucosyltransferase
MEPGPALGWAVALVGPALWRLGRIAGILGQWRRLPRVADQPPLDAGPLVTVLVPARNEARRIGTCLGSLLAQRYPACEFLVIDDGSEDGTAAIVERLATADARLRLLRVAGPPPGWTGKNFALAHGVARARGEWLCFTDADTVHAPDALGRALGFARARGLALLSLTSHQLTGSFWERVLQPVVFGLLDQWFPLARVNDPASPLAAASGIYILAERRAYEAAGGHLAVAGEVLEDVALARRVKRGGGAIAFANGADLVAARMYEDLATIRRGWTKNLYALRDRRPLRALASAAELAVTVAGPPAAAVGLAAAGRWPAAGVALLATALVVGGEAVFRRRRGHDPRWAPSAPLGALLVAAFLLESAARSWLGLGVRWKDRRYT